MSEEKWLRDVVLPELGEVDQRDDWAEWLHQLYVARGAVDREELRRLASEAQRQAAETASQLVVADVARTSGQAVAVGPLVREHSMRIACDGELSNDDSGGFFAIGALEAACEVADTVQDILQERWWKVWPSCSQHDSGMHVDLIGDEAVWLCRRGRHYTPIGELAEEFGSP
ncbi:hypothetical protein DQ237_05885 [Blastococcus sp. TF02-8]|uniref:hypothetical protein n=1 Tax=Blastococcus sp. TF02-8 TaxID=2250574 RepID=UPI000DE97E8A|nr:hypothetical protein [Blastococcus sp. TF02-8]RBY97107.1 hypothetical protein DQ237_05885 [Blastococcus sp. TF02-8]